MAARASTAGVKSKAGPKFAVVTREGNNTVRYCTPRTHPEQGSIQGTRGTRASQSTEVTEY